MQYVDKDIMGKKLNTIWQYRRILGSHFLECLAILLLIYELIEIFCSVSNQSIKIIIGVSIFIVSIVYALCRLLCKKKKLTLEINKRTKLTIQERDLFKNSDCAIVVPVNEFFDTHIDDGIINKNSIHGQFIRLFSKDIAFLRRQIDAQLSKFDKLPRNRERTMVNDLPQDRYPLGTCVRIQKNNKIYILVAVTRFNSNEHIEVSTEEFPEVIRKMFNGIEQLHDGKPVYIPLVGGGLAGYDLTNMQILNTIIQAAHLSKGLHISKGVTICLYGKEQIESLNLNVIEYLYNRWKTLK